MTTQLPIGCPLWKRPSVFTAGVWTNTRPVLPSAVTADHTEFIGATTRDGESAGDGQELQVQRTGDILVRVLGPVKFGDIVGQVPGADYLSSTSTTSPVGSSLQDIPTAVTTLIRVRTSSASSAADGFPFQILKVSETQVKIASSSATLRGLDCQNKLNILGLGSPFVVQKGFKIYLEILFDKTQGAFLASIGASAGWSGFPKLVRAVKNTEIAAEQVKLTTEFSHHVGVSSLVNAANLVIAASKLTDFASGAVFKQFYAYALIGYCTAGTGATGLKLTGINDPFTVVQCLETDLMLAGFCDSGVPSLAPIAYSAPFIETLPAPTIVYTPAHNDVTISMDTHPSAAIYYTMDGGTPTTASTLYSSPFAAGSIGLHTIRAFATQTGFFDSPVATYTYNKAS